MLLRNVFVHLESHPLMLFLFSLNMMTTLQCWKWFGSDQTVWRRVFGVGLTVQASGVSSPWRRSSTCRCDPAVSSCTRAAGGLVCPAAPPSGRTSLRRGDTHGSALLLCRTHFSLSFKKDSFVFQVFKTRNQLHLRLMRALRGQNWYTEICK